MYFTLFFYSKSIYPLAKQGLSCTNRIAQYKFLSQLTHLSVGLRYLIVKLCLLSFECFHIPPVQQFIGFLPSAALFLRPDRTSQKQTRHGSELLYRGECLIQFCFALLLCVEYGSGFCQILELLI